MAITCDIPISPSSQGAFNDIDALVMKCAYASQNYFGRLCEEQVYENDLMARLKAEGFSDVHSQVGVRVSHEGFEKEYRLDLVVNGVVYELKAKNMISSSDGSQVLNYAALLSLNRIKLINFGDSRVVGKLLGTPFNGLDRFAVSFDRKNWIPMSNECEKLTRWAEGFVSKVGGYLRSELYEESLLWSFGGVDTCLRRLPIRRNGLTLGYHACRLHSEYCAFVVTGMSTGMPARSYRKHLQSLLSTLPIRAIQWVNIHHLDVTFTTVEA